MSRFKEFWGVIQYPLIKNQVGIKIVRKKNINNNNSCYFHSNPFYHFLQQTIRRTSTINNKNLFYVFFVPRDVFISFYRRLYYFKHYPHCCYSLYVKFWSKQNMFQGICMFLCLFDGVSLKPFENKKKTRL